MKVIRQDEHATEDAKNSFDGLYAAARDCHWRWNSVTRIYTARCTCKQAMQVTDDDFDGKSYYLFLCDCGRTYHV